MAIAKIEPTGCTVRKGNVQLRFSFYLEPSDSRYEEHHIQVPIIPLEGYPGEYYYDSKNEYVTGIPKEPDYGNWMNSLPKKWQNNPFHNHFVYVDADITDTEIRQLLTDSLEEFYGIWNKGQDILKVWKSKGRLIAGDLSAENIQTLQLKVENIKTRVSAFEVKKV